MKRLVLLLLLCASVAKADSLVTFMFSVGVPSFAVPSDIGPQFSLNLDGAQWNFLFTQGDHFVDVDYNAFYATNETTGVGWLFDLPFYCAPWNTGCIAVGTPWNGSEFVPGDYGSITITESPSLATPEPSTLVLLGACLAGLLLWKALH
jgi:hypothetical protein